MKDDTSTFYQHEDASKIKATLNKTFTSVS